MVEKKGRFAYVYIVQGMNEGNPLNNIDITCYAELLRMSLLICIYKQCNTLMNDNVN